MRRAFGLLICVGLIFSFLSFVRINSDIADRAAAQTAENLIPNPGFEDVANDSPTGWLVQNTSGGGTAIVDTNEKHSGNNSWKLTQNEATHSMGAYSPEVAAKPGDFFKLSVWAKAEAGNETVYIGWEEFTASGAYPTPAPVYFVQSNYKMSAGVGQWQEFSAIGRVQQKDTVAVKVKFWGPYKSTGTIWWDDFSLTVVPDPISLGCVDNATTKCLDLGTDGDIADTTNWSAPLTEDKTNYREALNNKTATVSISAFNIDVDGYPLSPMFLEIRYKDTIDDSIGATNVNNRSTRASFNAKIDQTNDLGLNYYAARLAGLGEFGDGEWRTAKAPIAYTNWPMMKAVDGKFTFNIVMANAGVNLPVDYISLGIISDSQYQDYLSWEKKIRNLVEVAYQETNTNDLGGKQYDWFSTPLEKPIYPNYIPRNEELEKPLTLYSGLDDYVDGTFAIYSKTDLTDVSIQANDLNSSAGTLAASNIKVKRVVNNYKLWSYVNGYKAKYGLMPDYVENFSALNISPNSTQQFLVMVTVPKGTKAGTYTGNITLKAGGGDIGSVPISLEVLPMVLDEAANINYLYSSPYDKPEYSVSMDNVFTDIAGHDIEVLKMYNLFYPTKSADGTLTFNTTEFELHLQNSINKGVIKKHAFYWYAQISASDIMRALGLSTADANLWTSTDDPAFKSNFSKLVNQLIGIGNRLGIEIYFSVNDEPGADPTKRFWSHVLYPLIKDAGGKTWTTYWDTCEQPVTFQGRDIPSLAPLIDYKVYARNYITDTNVAKEGFGYYTTGISHQRNPVYNRFMHGIFAYKTGAKVVGDYAYGDYVADPYNDFDARWNYKFPFSYNDFVMSYPTKTGEMLPTLAWEGVHEGIIDARYIATLEKLISIQPDRDEAVAARKYLDGLKNRVSPNLVSDYEQKGDATGYANQIIKNVSDLGGETDYTAFDKARKIMFNFIKELNTPSLTITPSREYAVAGAEISYRLFCNNPLQRDFKDNQIVIPIPNTLEYINNSATGGGRYENGSLIWNLSEFKSGTKFEAEYKARIR